MNPSLAEALRLMKVENERQKAEIRELKQTLQYRHTTINDLRYSKKMLVRALHDATSSEALQRTG